MARKTTLDKYGIISHNDKKGTGKATILFHQKLGSKGDLLTEGIIWKITLSDCYPLGIKYRLILVNRLR